MFCENILWHLKYFIWKPSVEYVLTQFYKMFYHTTACNNIHWTVMIRIRRSFCLQYGSNIRIFFWMLSLSVSNRFEFYKESLDIVINFKTNMFKICSQQFFLAQFGFNNLTSTKGLITVLQLMTEHILNLPKHLLILSIYQFWMLFTRYSAASYKIT